MIVPDDSSLSHIEDTGFVILLKQPLHDIIWNKNYTDMICSQMYTFVEEKILSCISELTASAKLSFTTDTLSDNTSWVSLLSLMCHAVNDQFQWQHFVLCGEPLTDWHTREYLSEIFLKMLGKWKMIPD